MRKEALLTTALIAACVLVVTLSMQNRALRSEFETFVAESARPDVGTWMPSVPVRDTGGSSRLLGQARSGLQVLYFFEPSCPHCRVTAPAIRRLEAAVAREHLPVELIGLSHAPTAERVAYLREQRFGFAVVPTTSRIASLFRVHAVPLLMVLDRDGRVAYAHAGELTSAREVDRLLAVVHHRDERVGSVAATDGR